MDCIPMVARAYVLALALVAPAAGCAEPGPPVRVTHLQPFTHKDPTGGKCEPLGEVEGKGKSEPEMRYDLREKAREVGADTVLIDQPIGVAPAGRRIVAHAQLLRCAGVSKAEEPAPETPETSGSAAPPPASVEDRMAELQRLFDQGLITQEEYDDKRKALLDEL